MLTNTTEIGTATLPRRRLIIPAPTDVSPSAPRRPPRFPALAQFASAARRVPRAPIPVAFALAVLAVLATVAPEPAAAQTVTTFISNTGQTSNNASPSVRATAFTTGTGTYTLSSVGIFIRNLPNPLTTPRVQIYGDSGGNPGTTLLATMTNPGTFEIRAVNSFTAPANTTLSASTTYWVVTSNSDATNGTGFQVSTNLNTTLDSGAAAGWSIGAARFKDDIAATSWTSSSSRIRFAIRGTSADTTPPTLTSADVEITDALIINLGFSEDLQLSNPPALSAFTVTVDGSAATVSSVGVPGSVLPQNELWLQLSTAIRQRQAVVVTYTDATSGDDTAAIQDTAGNDAATFTTGMDGVPAVTNNSTVTNTVPADWSLIPNGLSTGDKFRLLFLSSTKRKASSSDIADYNTFIQTRAAAGHTDIQDYSADFRAVGCTADTDARDNTKTTYTTTDQGVPIYWLNGAKAADQYEDFYDGSWDEEANNKNESGTNGLDTSQNVNYPWTGCDHDGTEAVTGADSFALGTRLADARVGRPNSSVSGHGPLNGQTNRSDFNNDPLYGLSDVFQVAAAVVVTNNPPAFSADTAARSVAENTAAGQNVGAALTATDADSDTLTYTLEGTDAASFDIVSGSGQIRTRTGVTYNHEAKSTHTVVVKADDGNGGTDTIAVTITVTDVDEPPGQPAAPSVSATAGSTTSLDVTWTAPTNTGPAIASYDLQYRAGTSGNFTDGPQNVTGTSAAIASLMASTSHQVQVRATNAEGDGDWSFAGTGRTTATTAPGAPTGLTATASGSTAIDLSWSAPGSTGGSAITGYKIEVSPNGTSGWTDQAADTNSTATTYAHTGLAAGDTRHYRVSAINTNGTGDPSNVDSATTDAVPGAVSDVVVVPVPRITDSLTVSWSAPDNAGKPALTGYDVRYRSSGGGSWTTVSEDATSTSLIIGGLRDDFYDVQVRALNADNFGPWSSTAEGATPSPPERVYANHPLIPDDLGPGDSFRLLYITGATTAATGTGIHTYHNFAGTAVLAIINPGNLVSEWGPISLGQTALVSTPGADARLLTDTSWTETDRGMPIYWLNGARVADDYADFYDGTWADEANPTNGIGQPHSLAGNAPWTGTDHDGTELFNGTASRAVGQASVSVGGLGSTIPGAGPLNGGVIFASTEERPLYGLWHVLVVDENLRLINNHGQPDSASDGSDSRAAVRAQLFTTGPNSSGYGIGGIEFANGSDIDRFLGTVALYTTDTDGDPDLANGLHATLSLERAHEFTWDLAAPAGTVLKPNTTYALVLQGDGGTYPELWTIAADGENVPADGWSLADTLLYHNGTSWVEDSNGRSLVIEMVGPQLETEGPALVSATVGAAGNAVTLVFDENVVLPSDEAEALTFLASLASAFAVTADGAGVPVSGLTASSAEPDQLTIGLSGVIVQGQAVTLTYTDPTAGDDAVALQDVLGNETPTFTTGLHGVPAVINNSTITVLTTTAPGAPTGLTATASGTTAINLSWSAPASTGGSAITGYKIEVSPNGTSGWTDQVANTNSTATTYAHTGLAAGTTRHYRVSAINANGAGTASNVDSATTDATAPGAPTGLSATASGTTAIDLSWSAPASTGGSAITGYKIEVSSNGGSSWTNFVANTSNTTTTYAHTGLAAGTTRHYRVSAINTNGAGTASNVANATTDATAPGAPTGLTATADRTSRINIGWTAPGSTGGSAITGYRIEISSDGGSTWTDQVANTNSTLTLYFHSGPLFAPGTTRHFRVSAINANGTGLPSNVASATTTTTVPGAPTGLTAMASGTTAINLSWSAPGSTGGSAITGYRIEVSSNGGSSWTNLVANTSNTTTTYAHTGLAAGTTRHYRVSAINANGTGDPSNVANATTGATAPGAPTGLTATASGTTAINLSWSAPGSTGGSAITGYRIEVSSNGTSSWTNLVANTSNTTTTYAHTGLAAGTTRHYRVSAINTNGTGTASNVANATTDATAPGAPTGLTATASGTTAINLSWSAPGSTGGSAITGYRIEVSPNGTSSWTDQVANTNSTATTYAHTGLAAGDTRHYRVSAINTNGAGTASNVANATTGTTAPGAPTGLTATASGATQIDLSWSAPGSTGGSAITGYRIEVSPNGTSGWTDQVANTNSTATTYAHTGLAAGDTRHYRVSAINTNGAGTASNVANATTGTTVPGAPTGLTATASGTTAINLSWSAPASTGGSAITGYKIEVSPNGTSSWTNLVANTSNTATTYAHTGLAAGTTRHYRVSAINTNGTGVPSNVANATTDATAPGAPTGLTATASGTTAINLSWSAPASTGGSAITGYKIEVSSDGGSSWSDLVANTSNANTTYAHTGLTAGTTRHYRVSAINANGAGVPSNVATATTGATAPGAPTGLTATASGTTAINLSWGAPGSTGGSAITGYRIEVSSNGGSSWTNLVANTSNTTTTYAHTGLTAGATRHYRVSAINTNGTGTASNVANATTGQTTVTFGASSYTAAEGGATATVAVQLSAAASATVTIPLTKTHRGGATAADYSGVPSNVTFTAGQTRRTFTVTATDDADKDGGESVQLGFGTLPGGYGPGARRTATVTLVDDDANLIVNFGTERHTTVKVLESDTVWHRFIFSLSTSRYGPPNGNPQQPVTIPLVVTHRGGATPADYEVRGRRTLTSVTFAVGESVTSFSMRAIPDGRRETGEGLRLDFGRLPAGVRAGTWGPYETIAFVDQVLPGYTVLFGAEAYTATEGGAPARVSIHLSEPVEIEPLVVRLVVTHVGATAADYTGIPKSVRFEVGEQTQTITVKATDDTDDDDGESVTLSFVNDPNGRVRVRTGPASATVALADNDGPRRVTVSFGAVTYTATEGGADATVRVELDAAPGRSVTVPLTKAHVGGATEADYAAIPESVTFAANQTSRTFAVMATAGDGSDGGESVSIGFGTLPEGVFAGSPAATTVTLADGSEQRLVVNFGSSRGHTVQVREGARRLRLNVLLDSSPRRPVTIPLVVTHVGGATEADYAAIPESVTFAAGQTSAHYYVRALPDEEDETGEGLQLDFGPLPPGVRKGTWGPYETIDFLDPAPAANLSVSGTVVTVGFPGALYGGSTPSPRDFVVSVEAPGGEKAMAPVAVVAVEGSDVFLQLARPVASDDTVTLSYLADAMHPIRDEAGSPAAPLTDAPVRNQTPASGLGPEAGLRVQAGCAAEKDRVPKRRTVMATCGLAGGTQMANPAPLAALLEAAQVGAGTGRLDLSSRHLTDITALAGLTGLRELDLRDNAIEDLWPLAGLRGLEALYLSGNQISDLRPLAGLRGLKVLDLSGNQIADLSALAGLTGLQVLDLSGNQIADLWPLADLTGLRELDLRRQRGRGPLARWRYLTGLQALDSVRQPDRGRLSALSYLTAARRG